MNETMSQPGFFDLSACYEKLSESGDPLERLNEVIDWKVFGGLLNRARRKHRKSNAGRPAFHALLMFKILILQSLYNLSDHQMEYQIRDRLSFRRFLGLSMESRIPDQTTIWLFRETLTKAKVMEKLFDRFTRYLNDQGLDAECGSIVDASIVEVPRQRNSRNENKLIKTGEVPEDWKDEPNKLSQKDVDARWTKKNNETFYGYKDHVNVDTKHKLIRKYEVSPANKADIDYLEVLLDDNNSGDWLWADKAYRSKKTEALLSERLFQDRMHFRPKKGKWYPNDQARENHRRSKIRKRVEHVFGFMENSMNGMFIRTIGYARARLKIGMMNLTYNLCRFEQIKRLGVA